MSAFRPSFCLNGSFARVFKIFCQTHTHTHTHTHGTDHSTPAQARGNYTSLEQNLFIVPLHVLRTAPVLMHIHVHLHSWLGLMTSEPKVLTKKYSQGENVFLCNKFISSCIIMCIDFVAVTCIIMYCRTDMHQK